MSFSDARRCTASAKHSRQRCKNAAVTGFSVCRFHGAGSARQGRPGGRPIKSGRYSKYLPTQLSAIVADAQGYGRLLEMSDEINLVRGRIGQLLTLTASPPPDWQAAKTTVAALDEATRRSDALAFRVARQELEALIDAGIRERQVWDELTRLLDLLRRIVADHGKLVLLGMEVITRQQALILLSNLEDIIRRHVSNPSEIAAIAHELRQLTLVGSGGPADSATGPGSD